MCKIGLYVAVACSMCLSGTAVLGANTPDSPQTVLVTGTAAGIDSVAEQAARRDAERKAVSQVCGEIIGSVTAVRNAELINDKILALSAGYIVESEVLRTTAKPEEYVTECQIRAVVARVKLADAIAGLFPKPRVMVAARLFRSGPGSPAEVGGGPESVVEELLRAAKYDVFDLSQLAANDAAEVKTSVLDGSDSAIRAMCALLKNKHGV